MTDRNEAIYNLSSEIESAIDRCILEWDLPVASVVGTLHLIAHQIMTEQIQSDEDEE